MAVTRLMAAAISSAGCAVGEMMPGPAVTTGGPRRYRQCVQSPEQCTEVAQPAEVFDRRPPLLPGHRFHVLGDEDAPSVQDRERIGRRQAFGREVLRRQEAQNLGVAVGGVRRTGRREPAGHPVGAVGPAYEGDAEVELSVWP